LLIKITENIILPNGKGLYSTQAISRVGIQCSVSDYAEVHLVFGQWDAIAMVEAKTLFELARIVVGEVRGIQGVQDTTTLLQGEL
jgi:hypothetical protein